MGSVEDNHELARQYFSLVVPQVTGPLRTNGMARFADAIDWARVFEPLVEIVARDMTSEELQHAIAWAESATCQKMLLLAPKLQSLVAASLQLEAARQLAGGKHGE